MGIFNLLLAIPLANEYGGIGCAFATGLSMFVGNGLIMNWYYAKVTGLDIKEFWVQIGKISLGVILLTLSGYLLNDFLCSNSISIFCIKILIYTLWYCFVMYKWFMNKEEREKVQVIINKVRGIAI